MLTFFRGLYASFENTNDLILRDDLFEFETKKLEGDKVAFTFDSLLNGENEHGLFELFKFS